MSPIIPLKRCTKCGNEYPATTEYFHRHNVAKDKLYQQCKICKNAYYHTPNGKQVHRRKVSKWRKTISGKRSVAPRENARHAVGRAIANGKLQPPNVFECTICDNQAQEYHHPSYDRRHWLTVVPMCKNCHIEWHKHK